MFDKSADYMAQMLLVEAWLPDKSSQQIVSWGKALRACFGSPEPANLQDPTLLCRQLVGYSKLPNKRQPNAVTLGTAGITMAGWLRD